MKKHLTLLALIGLATLGVYLMFKQNDPADSEPRTIEVAMRMTVRDFLDRNKLQTGPRVPQGYVVNIDKIGDTSPIFFDDNWISLHVLDGAQSFDVIPGRTLQITQRAGIINGAAFRPFAQPKPLDEARTYVTELITSLEAKGWQPTSQIRVPSGPEDFDSGGEMLIAIMKSPSGNDLDLTLRDYGLAPKQESWIIAPDPNAEPAKSTRTYLLDVDVTNFEGDLSYGDLIYPRRIFEKGDFRSRLPLRYWVDDPHWTPEKVGMVPTTPDERPNAESSKWKMPPK
ncbi:hypothetical protein [Agrobacterium vaccinii]|uniref:hypothetical protein n=1 Tax=Agrobacterium vaccinii TaxID=2735528 RepID=UPI001E5263A9|nr:hypothetical protein [Agrobacterium vaccinii]UHS59995.1 hypothetical protein HRS00_24055 [Agrobacterium vaccinii]